MMKRRRFFPAVSDASVSTANLKGRKGIEHILLVGNMFHSLSGLHVSFFFLRVLRERKKLRKVDLISFVPFVGVNRYHAIPLNVPIRVIVAPGLE